MLIIVDSLPYISIMNDSFAQKIETAIQQDSQYTQAKTNDSDKFDDLKFSSIRNNIERLLKPENFILHDEHAELQEIVEVIGTINAWIHNDTSLESSDMLRWTLEFFNSEISARLEEKRVSEIKKPEKAYEDTVFSRFIIVLDSIVTLNSDRDNKKSNKIDGLFISLIEDLESIASINDKKNLSRIFYRLQFLSNIPLAYRLISVLTNKLSHSDLDCNWGLINELLQTCKDFKENKEIIHNFFLALIDNFSETLQKISVNEILKVMDSLKNCQNPIIINTVLSLIIKSIKTSNLDLNGNDIGEIFIRLVDFSSYEQIQNFISIIKDKLQQNPEILGNSSAALVLHNIKHFQHNNSIDNLISAVAESVNQSKNRFNLNQITKSLNGLQNCNHTFPVEKIILIITNKLRESRLTLPSSNVSQILYGIRNLDNCSSIDELLILISEILEYQAVCFEPEELISVFESLKNLKKSPSLERLIGAITRCLQIYMTDFNPRETFEQDKKDIQPYDIAPIFRSLINLTNYNSPTVEGLLETLVKGLKEAIIKKTLDSAVSAISGLTNFVNTPAAEELVTYFAELINTFEEGWNAEKVNILLRGLKNFSNCPGTEKIISKIADVIKMNNFEYDSVLMGKIFFNLQNKTPSVATEKLLHVLNEVLQKRKIKMQGSDIGNAFFGLVNFNLETKCDCVNPILSYLLKSLYKLENHYLDKIDIFTLTQVLSIYRLNIPKFIKQEYENLVNSGETKPNTTEIKAYKFLLKRCAHLEIRLNEYFNGFQMDLFIPKFKLNIELDGHSHLAKKTKDEKRDAYLKQNGINVIRIILDHNNLEDKLQALIENDLNGGLAWS